MLYRQPIWQCETTGRSNLTYAEAVASERKEKERVGDRFPEQLKACVLKRLQFREWSAFIYYSQYSSGFSNTH